MKEPVHRLPMKIKDGSPRDYYHWRGQEAGASWLFLGKGPQAGLEKVAEAVLPAGLKPSWLEQIHSSLVRPAGRGEAGLGDALHTAEQGLALAVVTADCVPVLLAAVGWAAAVHAGWRGIAQGIVAATLAEAPRPMSEISAWIGPAIGPCCYEVGAEVAQEIVAASGPEVAATGPRGKPHLDLQRAVQLQLGELGVRRIQRLDVCTQCHRDQLYSYRRDGRKAGRNVAMIWLKD